MNTDEILYTTSPRLYFLLRYISAILLPFIPLSLLLPISFNQLDFAYSLVIVILLLIVFAGIFELLRMHSLKVTKDYIILHQGIINKNILIKIDDIKTTFYNNVEVSEDISADVFHTRTLTLYTNYRTTVILNDETKWTLNTIMPHDYKNFRTIIDEIKLQSPSLTAKKLSVKEYWNDNQDGLKYFLVYGAVVIFTVILCFFFR